MRLDTKSKADIRFFTYYFVNGTLNFDLIRNQLKTFYLDYLENNPRLFFESFCIFINHKITTADIDTMHKRVAEYMCKTIEPNNFTHLDNFQNWELDFKFTGTDFPSCFKDFAYRLAFDKIERVAKSEQIFKKSILYGATFWETVFAIWANNLQIENGIVINQEYAIERASLWFFNPEIFEDWEVELEM
ncbi:MAG: hypothetical protein J0L54_16835 [Chitinophagales bacterium]|nr:hypothetical protein [Chitinophagales bacterium]